MKLDYETSTQFSASDNFQSDRASTTNFRGSSCESLQNLSRFAIQFAGLLKVFHLRLLSYTMYNVYRTLNVSVTTIYVNYLFSIYLCLLCNKNVPENDDYSRK